MHAPTRHSSPARPAPAADPARGDTASAELVYEVESSLDPAIAAEFDAWLPGHVDMVLAAPGFLGAEILRPAEVQPDGRARRISRYRVRDRAALDHYFEQLAPALRQDGIARFGDRATYSRRVLAAGAVHEPPGLRAQCANCGARLLGPFCADCGQHARESARSVGTLFHDAWHVMTHVDGRLWQTLRHLALSPGHLTNEYFRERRARYIPPFRLYLVLSLVFFGLASLTSAFDEGQIRVGGTGAAVSTDAEELAEAREELARAREELRSSGSAAGSVAGVALRALEQRVAAAEQRVSQGSAPAAAADGGAAADVDRCDTLTAEPEWLQPTLRRICERAERDGGKAVAAAFVANIPKMMFVFLPLMAALMLLLYRRPRRYYVEHLVFYLHVHAALFLALSVLLAVGSAVRGASGYDFVAGIGSFALFLYAAWYVWRAMRVHYGNGRALTLAKFAAISFFYVVFLSLTLAGTAVVSALVS